MQHTFQSLLHTSWTRFSTFLVLFASGFSSLPDCKNEYYDIITHPLIFAWFYWLLYVTWSKSPDSYHAITPARVDICPLIVSVEEKQSAQEFQLFFSSVNMEGNQTRFNECSDSDIDNHPRIRHQITTGFFTMFTRGLIEKRKLMGGL